MAVPPEAKKAMSIPANTPGLASSTVNLRPATSIVLPAERADAKGVGVDISAPALAVAMRNAEALGVSARAELVEGSWESELAGPFDLVLSNPPYIPAADMGGLALDVADHDPHLALTPGADGLAAYRALISFHAGRVRPGGWIGVECGIGQADDVLALMAGAGLAELATYADLAGIPRAAFGRRVEKTP